MLKHLLRGAGVYQRPTRERSFTVLLRYADTYAEGRSWIGSGSTVKSYIESVPTPEFGATTDVRQAAGYDIWLAAVLPQSARMRHSHYLLRSLTSQICMLKPNHFVLSSTALHRDKVR